MNSDRVDEIAALREQKKLDRQAEIEAREAKEAEEAKSHAANMERIAKKMARIEAEKNAIVQEPAAEEPAVEEVPAEEPVAAKPKPAPKKKKVAAKKPVAKAKGKTRGRPKGSKNKK
jgi:septal ring factor EnvC (AmiA/AmiB activator)